MPLFPTTSLPKKQPDLDLTGTSCPMAFVKTRIYLDQCMAEQIIEILYENTAANEPLVRSIEALGHKILPQNSVLETQETAAINIHTSDHLYKSSIQLKRIFVQVKK